MRLGTLFAVCATILCACTREVPKGANFATPTAPSENATIAALSTDVARNSTMIAYLATVVNAQRAGTPTPIGFVPTPTLGWTPTANVTVRMTQTLTTQPSFSPIEFRRTGGIVGLDDQLIIDDQGRAKLIRRTGDFEFDLAQEELARLRAALRDARFASIPEDSRRKPYLVPDEISYVIVYQEHTVKTSDTAIPDKLQSVIQLLNGIMDVKGKRQT